MNAPTAGRRRVAGLLRLEFVRFAAVGASSTLIYLGVYSGAVLLGVPFLLAAFVAFGASGVNGYLLHHRWTFRTTAPSGGGLGRWLMLQGAALGVNVLGLWALVTRAGVDRLVAQAILLPLLPLTTYLLSRRRIFAPPSAGPLTSGGRGGGRPPAPR